MRREYLVFIVLLRLRMRRLSTIWRNYRAETRITPANCPTAGLFDLVAAPAPRVWPGKYFNTRKYFKRKNILHQETILQQENILRNKFEKDKAICIFSKEKHGEAWTLVLTWREYKTGLATIWLQSGSESSQEYIIHKQSLVSVVKDKNMKKTNQNQNI